MMKDKIEGEKVPFFSRLEGSVRDVDIALIDPLGSYTGKTVWPDEVPVQDADDL